MTAPGDDSSARQSRNQAFLRILLPLVALNVVAWVIWAVEDRDGGTPWPVWVSLASAVAVFFRLGRLVTGPPTTGRQRNSNRNRR
jgi:hypothetical protein